MFDDILKPVSEDKTPIGYDLNEQDIDGVLRYMQLHDPEHATPERAIRFLAEWKKTLRERDIMAASEAELESFYTDFIKRDDSNE